MNTTQSIEAYFAYFRKRAKNLQRLLDEHGPLYLVERCTVLAAAIDSLAAGWGGLVALGQREAGPRMCGFLCTYDNPNWARCSLPDLLRRAQRNDPVGVGGLAAPIQSLFRSPSLDGIVREWEEDPFVKELLNTSALSTVAQHVRWDKNTPSLEQWLNRSRFGEMLYRYFRKGYLHTLGPNRSMVVTEEDREFNDPPNYENISSIVEITDEVVRPFGQGADGGEPTGQIGRRTRYARHTRKTPRVQFDFLLKALRNGIDGFEKDCRSSNYDPVPY
jgi:hypothetical protein